MSKTFTQKISENVNKESINTLTLKMEEFAKEKIEIINNLNKEIKKEGSILDEINKIMENPEIHKIEKFLEKNEVKKN